MEAGSADFGVVPVENSTEGAINHTLDMFVRSPLKICGDVEMPVGMIPWYMKYQEQREEQLKKAP